MGKVHDPVETATRLRAHVHHAALGIQRVLDAIDAIEAIAAEFATEFGAVIKVCGCGASYDREAWGALEYCGEQDDETELAELRHCTCGSTIGVVIGPSPRRRP